MIELSRISFSRTMFVKLLQSKKVGPFIKKFGGAMLRHIPGMITCAQFEEFLIDYSDNRLTPSQIKLFERHMKLCPMCKTAFKSYLKTIELGQAICKCDQSFIDAPQELINAILEVSYHDKFK